MLTFGFAQIMLALYGTTIEKIRTSDNGTSSFHLYEA
jgi:hypothetical protein